jgi:hypothetical protein
MGLIVSLKWKRKYKIKIKVTCHIMRWKSLSGKEPRREEKPDIKRDMKENK